MNDDLDQLQLSPADHVFIGIARLLALGGSLTVLWLGVGVLVGAPR